MPESELWSLLCAAHPRVPSDFGFDDGVGDDRPYRHKTSVLALSFAPDDSLLALAGGGMIPGADSSVRLIDAKALNNVSTLRGHVCGIHDVSFDPQSGLLASASFDYGVYLWNLEQKDVIILLGEDERTKGRSRFSSCGSMLAIGEYPRYSGPHSFHLYDLVRSDRVMKHELPDEMGVDALAFSPDASQLAIAVSGRDSSEEGARLLLVDAARFAVARDFSLPFDTVYDLVFADPMRLIIGVSDDTSDISASAIFECDLATGAFGRSVQLPGNGVCLARNNVTGEIAVANEGTIRRYQPDGWRLIDELRVDDTSRLCSVTYSNTGDRLAYGCSNGRFAIADL